MEPDCSFYNSDFTEDMHERTFHPGVFTARSYHHGGVNSLLMDGSAHFVKDSVSLAVWRAIATRSGNDIVSEF